jgi:hypothetical protein
MMKGLTNESTLLVLMGSISFIAFSTILSPVRGAFQEILRLRPRVEALGKALFMKEPYGPWGISLAEVSEDGW